MYLDHAAATPLKKEALDAMMPYLTGGYGNPSSAHEEGRRARQAIEKARETIAACVDTTPENIYFTPSATAANNAVLEFIGWSGSRIFVSPLEHPSVLKRVAVTHSIREVALDRYGRVDAAAFEKTMTEKWANGVSICWACSETGVLNPIPKIAEMADSKAMFLHSDATQAIGRVPTAQMEYKPDFITFSAHKLGGPRGVGIIVTYNDKFNDIYMRYSKNRIIYGGSQEKGIWPGTENTAAIIGSAAAIKAATENMEECNHKILLLRERLLERLGGMKGIMLNTPKDPALCVPGIVSVSVPRMDGAQIVMEMDEAGVAVSSGSACSTGSTEPSHAIMAASGGNTARARGAVRFSFNDTNTAAEIDYAMDRFAEIIKE